ncbi:MAG: YbaN family protein [Eggerthellaceae bacterium]|nr:YbaN family protein [Eggerthellaceae bacterium]
MNSVVRYIMLGFAWVCFAAGCIGVFVPVLPTTPLLLLATFLFARYSPRLHAWIRSTTIYQKYVAAFKEAGGIPVATKVRILAVSYMVMLISAIAVQMVHVWVILGCVALFLLWLMVFRIPTISQDQVEEVRESAS